MPTALKVILIIYASYFSATTAWYVTFEPDFVYKSNMTFDETVRAFREIKNKEGHLIPPIVSINGRNVQLKDTFLAVSKFNINYYDTLEKAVYQVNIYQDGFNQKHTEKKTYIRYHYLLYTNGRSIPYVRENLKTKNNIIRRKRFEAVVIDKVRAELSKSNQETEYQNRVKRVIHYLQ